MLEYLLLEYTPKLSYSIFAKYIIARETRFARLIGKKFKKERNKQTKKEVKRETKKERGKYAFTFQFFYLLISLWYFSCFYFEQIFIFMKNTVHDLDLVLKYFSIPKNILISVYVRRTCKNLFTNKRFFRPLIHRDLIIICSTYAHTS